MSLFINSGQLVCVMSVTYKLVTKTLVNKIRYLMPHLIAPNQVSFVSGGQIHDNIIVIQEIIHSKRRMKRRLGFMSLKTDLAKAYDSLSWYFINDTLKATCFPT